MPSGQPDDPGRRARERFMDLVLREAFDDAAVAELAAFGLAATPALAEGAALEDPRARRLALRALALIPSRKAIATLLNAAESETDDPELAAICLRGAIAALTPDDAPKVRDFLLARLDSEDPFVRAAAIDGLAKVRADDIRDRLLTLAADDHPFVAERATAALGGPPDVEGGDDDVLLAALASAEAPVRQRAIDRLLARDDADAFIAAHLGIDHRRIRRSLTEAAIARSSTALYEALATRIEDPEVDDDERARALRALRPGGEHDDEIHEKRLARFGRSPDLFVRASAAVAALSSNRRATREVAARALRDRDVHVRETVAKAFAADADSLGGAVLPMVIDEIRRLATEAQGPDDERVASLLIRGLESAVRSGAWVDDRAATAVSPWIRAFGATTRDAARSCYDAIRGVDAATNETESTSIEQDLASDDDARVQLGLERLVEGDASLAESHVDALLELLYRASPEWQASIATILGRTTSARARRAIERLARSDDETVAAAARDALASTPAATVADADDSESTSRPTPAGAGAPDDNPYAPPATPDAPLPPSKSWGEPWQ